MHKPTSGTQLAAFLFVYSWWLEPHDAVQCRAHGLTFKFLFEFQTEFFVWVSSCSTIKLFNYRGSTVYKFHGTLKKIMHEPYTSVLWFPNCGLWTLRGLLGQSREWVHIDINSQSISSCLNCVAAITSMCCLDGANKLLTMLSYFLQDTNNKIHSCLTQIFEEMGNFEQKTAYSLDYYWQMWRSNVDCVNEI